MVRNSMVATYTETAVDVDKLRSSSIANISKYAIALCFA